MLINIISDYRSKSYFYFSLIYGKKKDALANPKEKRSIIRDPEGQMRKAWEGSNIAQTHLNKFIGAAASRQPIVVSTNPSNGELDVSRNLEWISVTFSEEMGDGYSVSVDWDSPAAIGWPLSGATALTWGSDGRTFLFSRENVGKRLVPGITIQVTLNPPSHPPRFKDISGNALEPYTFAFTTRKTKPCGRARPKNPGP